MGWLLKWVQENEPTKFNSLHVIYQIEVLAFGAVHTTSMVLTHALFELASRVEYHEPLRREIEECVATHRGMNKQAVEAMWDLDSFLRETQRLNPQDSGAVSIHYVIDSNHI